MPPSQSVKGIISPDLSVQDVVGGPEDTAKCTVAMRMLALGIAADAVGEMVRIGKSTCVKTNAKFARVVVEVFGAKYLREPNA
ncbi:hypothetical protein D1007_25176 [Hordeum vulgare]|nr:hypothetical protein D1007_25176 [Hordeum vulgare]